MKRWRGQTCAIFASGPSLTQADVDRCRKLRTIAINNCFQVAPWADVLYACDWRWWTWHPEALNFKGEKFVMASNEELSEERFGPLKRGGVNIVWNDGSDGLSDKPDHLRTGNNGGYQAINLAYQFGVRRIILLGYDMRVVDERAHWHPDHPVANQPNTYSKVFLPKFRRLAPILVERGLEVVNCTPGSALDCFPMMTLEDALA